MNQWDNKMPLDVADGGVHGNKKKLLYLHRCTSPQVPIKKNTKTQKHKNNTFLFFHWNILRLITVQKVIFFF